MTSSGGDVPCDQANGLYLPPGTTITDAGGIGADVPQPGETVVADADAPDTSPIGSQDLVVANTAGQVFVNDCGNDSQPQGTPLGSAASPAACSDSVYNLVNHKWKSTFYWYFDAPTTPSNLTADNAEAWVKDGRQAIVRAYNDCGMTDTVTAAQQYQGRTSTDANINAAGDCGARDGTSVADFSVVPSAYLAVTCTWSVPDTQGPNKAVESDASLNNGYRWWAGGSCPLLSNAYSVRTVMTHESGHTFGLGHVSESTHGNLTMSTAINGACQESEYTLGRGDVLGLKARY